MTDGYRTHTKTGIAFSNLSVTISTEDRIPGSLFDAKATLSLHSGPMYVQTYPDADELRAMARAMLAAAADLELMAHQVAEAA